MDGDVPLALMLLRASRWFDTALLLRLEQEGFPRLNAPQSLIFAYLDETGTAPSELARRLGQTRQATSDLVAGVVGLGLLEVVRDPAHAGRRLVLLTDLGLATAQRAGEILAELEQSLGVGRGQALRRALGAVPTATLSLAEARAVNGGL